MGGRGTVREILAVAIGGAAGSVLRYWASNAVYLLTGRMFPYGTLAVNVLGSLIMGALYLLFAERQLPPEWRVVCLVGFLGGFTTFSAFSIETVLLLERGEPGKALANVLLSVFVCVGFAFLGYAGARLWLNQGT